MDMPEKNARNQTMNHGTAKIMFYYYIEIRCKQTYQRPSCIAWFVKIAENSPLEGSAQQTPEGRG